MTVVPSTAPATSIGSNGGSHRMGRDAGQPLVAAYYLPQFHPVPENDLWWGPGFTEWITVARARPLRPGHRQPRLPGALGFYDLRLPDVRAEQAELALRAGIDAFCYWHYWFAGRQLLERPFQEVLAQREVRLGFLLAWANHSWTGAWSGKPRKVLLQQTYPGDDDHRAHFASIEAALHDDRYLRIDGRPIFVVYRPDDLPTPHRFSDLWRQLAAASGLPGIYLVGEADTAASPHWDPIASGFDACVELIPYPHHVDYGKLQSQLTRRHPAGAPTHPSLIVGWDNTPRYGRAGFIVTGDSPCRLREAMSAALSMAVDWAPQPLLFLKSWNEWAEGNYLEPDRDRGSEKLLAVRDAILAQRQPLVV
jgi:Glycosyltransferase WbsX